MKKHILLGTALASLFALGACDYNEDNFPGFDEKETITDVSTIPSYWLMPIMAK